MKTCKPYLLLAALLLAGLIHIPSASSAVIPSLASFDADAEGWDAGTGDMTVGWSGTEGNPAGALEGSFSAQGMFFIPEQGSFRINSGSEFLGAYDNVITGFSFDFMALSVLPTDLSLNLYSGLDAFYIPIVLSGMDIGVWKQFTVSLADLNWVGNSSVLDSVTSIELTVTRGNSEAQLFYLDNFETVDTDFGGGGGESVIPEPATLILFSCSWLTLYAMRKKVRQTVAGRDLA